MNQTVALMWGLIGLAVAYMSVGWGYRRANQGRSTERVRAAACSGLFVGVGLAAVAFLGPWS